MATIGTFTASDNGYTGSVKTLTLNVKAKFVATEKENDKAPDYRIFAGATEFGAAWKKTARETRARISLGQARRSELPGPDLRLAGEGRGRRQLHADLVPPQRRLIQPDRRSPASSEAGLFSALMTATAQKEGVQKTFGLLVC